MIEVAAQPFAYRFDPARTALVVIDMQRDFLEPGGFGETLGNDLAPVVEIVPTVAALIATFRDKGWTILHTRESHAPDLSDCPPAKRAARRPSLRIGDAGPMGRILVRGEPGAAIVDACAPAPGEIVVDKPGKGMFYATDVGGDPEGARRSRISCSPASRRKSACRRRCARRTIAATSACLIEDATASYFPAFKAATLDMIRAQGAIVGWTTPLAAFRKAIA